MAEVRSFRAVARHVLILVAIVVMASERGEAVSYFVGDSVTWKVPPNGAATYSDWASQYSFKVGDVLVFNFVANQHDVAVVSEADFTACNTGSPIEMFTVPPVNYTLNATGNHYFVCAYDSHCSSGQKLAVTVGSGSSTPSPPPPPGTTTTTPSPPPPSGSPPSTLAKMPGAFLLGFLAIIGFIWM